MKIPSKGLHQAQHHCKTHLGMIFLRRFDTLNSSQRPIARGVIIITFNGLQPWGVHTSDGMCPSELTQGLACGTFR